MNTFTNIAYNQKGEILETETHTDSWEATEICLAMSQDHGYAETLDAWGKHCGEYGDRPHRLGARAY